jgi:hypothetical protein
LLTVPVGKNESVILERMKQLLHLNSEPVSDYYVELLLVLDLYTEGVVNRVEAVRMAEPLFKINNYAEFINNNFASLRKVIHKEEHVELQKYI